MLEWGVLTEGVLRGLETLHALALAKKVEMAGVGS